jgi:phosphoserine phosphatase RsbU/P
MGYDTSGRLGGGVRKRIAVVLDMFDVKYQAELVRQLRIAAEQRATELVVFPGGWLSATHRGGARRRIVFDLVDAASVDGVIVVSSCLSADVGAEGVRAFCERFKGLPVCAIGDPVESIPSVLVDNAQGVRSLLTHLIVDHGYRRFGFIRGPLGNSEAEARHAACIAELAAFDIVLDPQLVRSGDFLSASGRIAARSLLEDTEAPIQAIVAANDYMALGALEVLEVLGSNLGRSVAVVGFDNIDESNFSSPPLTTVEQPFAQLAAQAVRNILSLLQGQQAEPKTLLSTSLVVRHSCGCLTEGPAEARLGAATSNVGSFEVRFALQRDALRAEMLRASRGSFRGVSKWESQLLGAFVDDLRGVPGNGFITTIDRILRGLSAAESEIWRFHDVITVLRARTLQLLGERANERAHAEDLLQLARSMTAQAVMRAHTGSRLALEGTWRAINDLGTALGQCMDEATFAAELDHILPMLGVNQAFVARYLEPSLEGGPRRAQLVYGLDKSKRLVPAAHEPYLARELLPGNAARHAVNHSWVVLPLFYQKHDDGFALIGLDSNDGAFYEALRVHISAGLGGLLRPGAG